MKIEWNKLDHWEQAAAVAVHVMGWRKDESSECFWVHEDGSIADYIPEWFPQSDSAACAEVEEKFPSFDILRRYEFGYEVTIYPTQDDKHSVEASAENKREAFCVAALRASGIEVVQ